MKDPPFCINLATAKAMSSAGLCGTAPPKAVNLQLRKQRHQIKFDTIQLNFAEFAKKFTSQSKPQSISWACSSCSGRSNHSKSHCKCQSATVKYRTKGQIYDWIAERFTQQNLQVLIRVWHTTKWKIHSVTSIGKRSIWLKESDAWTKKKATWSNHEK